MSEQPGQERLRNPADLFQGVYSEPYNEIVQPARVWAAGKYFLRRWSAYLTPAEMWLVIGARQLSYLNRRRSWFTAYDNTLADAAGLNVDVYRRTVKRAISDQEGAIAHFLRKKADPQYVVRDDVPRKGRTRYLVRLDDPLTPADAAALARWLQERLPAAPSEADVVQALDAARAMEPQRLWASTLAAEGEVQDETLLTVVDVVRHVAPHLAKDDGNGGWQAAAGALHNHLIAGELVHLEPHYFREKWLPALGSGPALLIVNLRSLCYFNEDSGEIRDVVHVEANALAQQLQTTTRTLRRWFKKLEEATEDRLFGPFFTFLENQKQADQSVIASYRINLRMPLTPEDLGRYHALSAQRKASPASNGNGARLPDKMSVTGGEKHAGVADIKSVTSNGAPDKISVTQSGVADKKSVSDGGQGQIVGNGVGGAGQKVGPSRTKGLAYKYYERLLTILQLENIKQLEQNTEQQYQHLWRLHDGRAQEALAVVVADSTMALLEGLGIQEPARSRLIAQGINRETIAAWHLYAQQQPNLDQPLAFVVARALAGERPPAHCLELAQLSWEQWRTYAAVAALAPAFARDEETTAGWPCFAQWFALYGQTEAEQLPFDVGKGLAATRPSLQRAPDGEVRHLPQGDHAGRATDSKQLSLADSALWDEALEELRLQMTQSTFDAWLRGSRLLRREGRMWTVGVASPAAQSWLQNRLSHVIERTLGSIVGEELTVQFVSGEG